MSRVLVVACDYLWYYLFLVFFYSPILSYRLGMLDLPLCEEPNKG
jgi:hypothetical protein